MKNGYYRITESKVEETEDFISNPSGKTGTYLWKFPNHFLFSCIENGVEIGGILLTEKEFKGLYESIPRMEKEKVYRSVSKGISKRTMTYKTFQKKMKNHTLKDDDYLMLDKDSIRFMRYEKGTFKTFSIPISRMGEIYKKLRRNKHGNKKE